MPSKTYSSSAHHLRRLSWPTLINPNVLICKSRTMEFDEQHEDLSTNNGQREVRLIKLNGRQSFKAANSTLVDNLFRSIRKRKLKHPINCFNRKNVKMQMLFACPTSAKDHLHIVNLNRSTRSALRNPTLSQSAINLTELDNGLAANRRRPSNQRGLRCARLSVDEIELLSKWRPCVLILKKFIHFEFVIFAHTISNEILLIRLAFGNEAGSAASCSVETAVCVLILGWLIRL